MSMARAGITSMAATPAQFTAATIADPAAPSSQFQMDRIRRLMIAKRVSRRQFFAFTSLSNHLTSLERWPTGTLIEASVAMPILDRSRFLRILNLTDSPNDSEALSAVRRANALLHASNSPSHSPSRCDLRHRSLPTPSYKRFSIDADCATDADCRAKNWRPGRT